MCKEESLVVVLLPRGAEVDRDILAAELLLVQPWLCDVAVVHQAAVLGVLHVVGIDIGMHAVVVAAIVAIDRSAELAVLLGGVVSTCIIIVQTEANAGYLVDVGGEIASDTFFTVLLVAVGVVGNVGDGTLGVGEEKV